MTSSQALAMSLFALPAFWGGLFLSLVAGPLGSFLVWRRLAYLADAFAHSAVLAFVLAIWIGLPFGPSIFLFAIASALVFSYFFPRFRGQEDTLLVLFSAGAMSLGFVLMSFLGLSKSQMMGYLVGDLWVLSFSDLWLLGPGCLAALVFLAFFARSFLSIVTGEEFARVEGIRTGLLSFVFMVLIFLFVLMGIKWAGSLFITLSLVCPMMIIAPWVRGPWSVLIGAFFVGGIFFVPSFYIAAKTHFPLGASFGFLLVVGVFCSRLLKGLPFLKKWIRA